MRLKRIIFIVGFSSAAFVSINAQGTKAVYEQPAEMQEAGPLNAAIPFSQLLYVSGPDIDRFVYNTSINIYLLLAGRCFSALERRWSYAGNKFSVDFSKKLPGFSVTGAANAVMKASNQLRIVGSCR